ncbi:class III lanthionine synthetase LanKC [Streptomyces sp. Ru87]|uniref:class III lanthionine synthetase LanKC n=1 Tax=Streptomyces sp. Ru87 TaxID=2044307 RepID=UPI000BF975DB|nr:class III lanthionine synthetase LanKC [Streptomyces sp. Ru87]PGH50602.1 lantipeptide synthetase [Streptomyces sp. Ru87]
MDQGYAVFCDADRHFYDAPHRLPADSEGAPGALYEHALRDTPPGWQRNRSGDWLAFRPPGGAGLPAQGWKIHVSACLDNAEKVLTKVWDYCVPREIAFKFIPGRHLLHTRNAKYADRGGSGKFVTVYPASDDRFREIAGDLAELLDGEPGPYILSDLRWGNGPVYVRYGSFTERNTYDADGALRPAVEDPRGRLVPDRRDPAFHVPDWVELPACLEEHLAARGTATTASVPYRVERALHFSNGGGVYAATDTRTGERVVLKEGRPHAGLAADGADAVTRLERERAALERLAGLPYTPEVRDTFTLGDHHFLVLEHIDGRPLNTFFARRHPLIEADPGPERLAEYTAWALRIHGLVTEAVDAVHARGVVFNDLHLFNIMVSEDESSVVLLDFEAAAPAAENRRQVVANPGFVAPAGRRGTDVDRYALACLRIALFLPLTSLFAIDRGKAAHLAEIAAEQFPVDPAFLDAAVTEILRDAPGEIPRDVPGGARTAAGTDPSEGPSGADHGDGPGGTGTEESGEIRTEESSAVRTEGTGAVRTEGAGAVRTEGAGAVRMEGAGAVRAEEARGVREEGRLVRTEESGAAGAAGVRAVRTDEAGAGRTAPGAGRRGPAGAGRGRYLPVDPADWPRSRDSMVRAVLASATPHREDRYFPGDIAQFGPGGGATYGYGAAGVLHALAETGGGRCEDAEEWLLRRAARPPSGTPLGFYDGLSGIAWTLDRLGHTGPALELADTITAQDRTGMALDLHSGLAGLGLALDSLAASTGESALHDEAVRIARLVADRTAAAAKPSPRAGLLHGATGTALLFLRLHERTGDPGLLDLAADALDRDLARCVRGAGGALQVDEGRRTMPYLGAGSVGIGMVLDDWLAHRDNDAFDRARGEIVQAAQARFYAQPGLFRGAAGMVLHLARTTTGGPGTEQAALRRQIASLSWGAVPYRGELAFPGEQMMRLSMDLSTGTAGCLLALGSALHDQPVHLPFLPPLTRPHEPVSAGGRTREIPVPTDDTEERTSS